MVKRLVFLSFAGILLNPIYLYAVTNEQVVDHANITQGSTLTVTLQSPNQQVTNNCPYAIYVPLKSSGEWAEFIAHHPDCVVISGLPVNGVCGTAARSYSYEETGFTGTFCAVGSQTPAAVSFPAAPNSVSWTCSGSNGGLTATCVATHKNPVVCVAGGDHTYDDCLAAGGYICSDGYSSLVFDYQCHWEGPTNYVCDPPPPENLKCPSGGTGCCCGLSDPPPGGWYCWAQNGWWCY